tara:strand:+ start:659 stop:874 length:216 start_codon:yes stop_codon:yes gene_type:complete
MKKGKLNLDNLFNVFYKLSSKEISEKTYYKLEDIQAVSSYYFYGAIYDEKYCNNFLEEIAQAIINKCSDRG